MIIYNVTIKVNVEIAQEWRIWMIKTHIPMLMNTGCFIDSKFYRLLEQDDTDGPTYVVQYFCNNMSDYRNYIDNYAKDMRSETLKLWTDKIIAFRSIMELQ